MFPHFLTVFPEVNFPVVDLLDRVIFDELVDDFMLIGLHLHLALHDIRRWAAGVEERICHRA